jgi:hypothetical protein
LPDAEAISLRLQMLWSPLSRLKPNMPGAWRH